MSLKTLRRVATGLRAGVRPSALGEMTWGANNRYHAGAESQMDAQWDKFIWPRLQRHSFDLARTVDFACGLGRNTVKLLGAGAGHVTMVDIDPTNIAHCRVRFQDDARVRAVNNDGRDLRALTSSTFTTVYSWDAMVHFAPEVVDGYLQEFARVLKPSGQVFMHHSNLPSERATESPQKRAVMSVSMFRGMAAAAGFEVLAQDVLDWGADPALDCISVLRKP